MLDKDGYSCDNPELLNVVYTKETQVITINYSFIEVKFEATIKIDYERQGAILEQDEIKREVVDGYKYDLGTEFDKTNYTLKDSGIVKGVWDKNSPLLIITYENTLPDVTGFNVTQPIPTTEADLGETISVMAKAMPADAYQQEWKLEAKEGTTVSGKTVTGTQTGKVEFVIVSVDKPTVRTTASFNVVDPGVETLNMDNTVKEIQAELVHRGIEFNQKDNKTKLLEKLK